VAVLGYYYHPLSRQVINTKTHKVLMCWQVPVCCSNGNVCPLPEMVWVPNCSKAFAVMTEITAIIPFTLIIIIIIIIITIIIIIINHLFHTDDLKLIGRSEEELINEIKIVKTFSDDKN
jgi:hypothetical protein